jgi:16S rRNA (uracil1498-N3)-methyltransferase
MLRAYHPYPLSANAGALTLDGAESRHLLKSLRAREGEAVEVFDGKGRVWYGNCLSSDQFGLRIAIGRTLVHPRPAVTITLAQVLPKGGLFDDLIRTAAEIGASRIIPLTSERCEVKLTGDRADSKAERWNTLAVEALKQSGNPWLIDITPVRKLAPWLPEAIGENTLGLTASLEEDAAPIATLELPSPTPKEVVLLVGPEGDLSPKEYESARTAGFRPVSLGANVLRLETAAMYGLVSVDLMRRRIAGR